MHPPQAAQLGGAPLQGCLGLWQNCKGPGTTGQPLARRTKVGVPLVIKAAQSREAPARGRFAFYMHIQQRGNNKANLPTVIVACTVV